jgi:glutamyl-tRNA reductase
MPGAPHGDSLGDLLLLGTSRRRLPSLAAEALFDGEPDLGDLLTELASVAAKEAMVLSTRERLEYIVARGEQRQGVADLIRLIARRSGIPASELGDAVYIHEGEGAIRHLFEVAASLDGETVGAAQILEELTNCHRAARARRMTGPVLDSVLAAACAAARRVRTETPVAERPASMAAVAVEVARSLHGNLARARVLLVGLGEMSELLGIELKQAGVADITTVHQSARRAEAAARRFGGHFATTEDLETMLTDAEIVVSDRGAGQRTLRRGMVENALKRRRNKPILLIDAGLPADIEDSCGDLADAFLYRLDDLERIAQEGKSPREAASVMAYRILEKECASFLENWFRPREDPLTALRLHFDALRREVLDSRPPDAEEATRRLVECLLHAPGQALTEASAKGSNRAASLEGALRRLFGLRDGDGDGGKGGVT